MEPLETSAAPPAPAPAFARHAVTVLLHVLFIAGGMGAMTALGNLAPDPDHVLRESQEKYATQHYDAVIVGNALAFNQIDTALLSSATGMSVGRLTKGDSEIPLWYMAARNLLGSMRMPPRMALIVFNDFELTDPSRYSPGYLLSDVQSLREKDDPVADARVLKPAMGQLQYLLYQNFRSYRLKTAGHRWLERTVQNAVAASLFLPKDSVQRMVEKIIPETETPIPFEPTDVRKPEENIAGSFLPPLLDELKRQGIRPVLVRARTRRYTERASNASTVKYMDALRAYVQSRGGVVLDYAEDPRITRDHFADSLHLNLLGQKTFTEILAQDISSLPAQ